MKLDFAKTILLLALSFCLKSTACPEEYNPDVNTWVAIKKPNRLLAGCSPHDWDIKVAGKKVCAELTCSEKSPTSLPKFDARIRIDTQSHLVKPTSTYKLDKGWIIAYNRGEFGAAVYWFNEDGKKKQYITNLHINGFQKEGDRIIAVSGLAHMMSNRGSLVEFIRDPKSKKWSVKELIKLSESAELIAKVKPGDYVIATTTKLLRVNLKKEVTTLVSTRGIDPYPNSMLIDKNTVYIGMSQFVARYKLTPKNQQIDWLIPTKKWLNTNPDPFQ